MESQRRVIGETSEQKESIRLQQEADKKESDERIRQMQEQMESMQKIFMAEMEKKKSVSFSAGAPAACPAETPAQSSNPPEQYNLTEDDESDADDEREEDEEEEEKEYTQEEYIQWEKEQKEKAARREERRMVLGKAVPEDSPEDIREDRALAKVVLLIRQAPRCRARCPRSWASKSTR